MKRRVKFETDDPDILGSLPALRRAARAALRLAIEKGVPCYVLIDGKIVDLAARTKRKRRAARAKRARRTRA